MRAFTLRFGRIAGKKEWCINKLYHNYDNINIVSLQGKQIFDEIFPHFAAKSRFYPNKINKQEIRTLAEEQENPFKNQLYYKNSPFLAV